MTIEEKRIYQKQWRDKNKEKISSYAKEYGKQYYQQNKNRLKIVRKKWEEMNKKKRTKIATRYRKKHKDVLNKRAEIFRKLYPEKVKSRLLKYRSTIQGKFKQTANSAKSRGLSFSLTFTQFETIINQPCSYCGDKYNIGIDRIDNNIGYLIDNCCACCLPCNMMKKTLPKDLFLSHIKKIANYNI